jgi:hypothetical protein
MAAAAAAVAVPSDRLPQHPDSFSDFFTQTSWRDRKSKPFTLPRGIVEVWIREPRTEFLCGSQLWRKNKKSEGKEERHYEGIDSTKRIRGGDGEGFRGVESKEICAADGFGREVVSAAGGLFGPPLPPPPQIFESQVLYSSLLYFPFLNQLLNFSPIENLFFCTLKTDNFPQF